MSGLNDDVDEGLSNEIDTPDINPEQPIPEQTTFVLTAPTAKQDEPSITQLFGDGVVEGELPNVNAQFVLAKESFYKLIDLLSIKKDLIKANGISKEDAEVLNSQLPGFINEDKPIGFFTEDKSRTQLVETLNTIDKAIDVQLLELSTKSSELVDVCHQKYSTELKDVQSKIIAAFSKTQEEFTALISSIQDIQDKPSEQIKQFLDHNTSYYHTHNGESCHQGLDDNPGFLAAIEKIKKFISLNRNSDNVAALLHFVLLKQSTPLFSINSFLGYTLVTKESPYFHVVKEDTKHPNINCSFYEVLAGGTSAAAVTYLNTLAVTALNLISDMGNRKQSIQSLMSSDEQNLEVKLQSVFKLHSDNSIDAVNCLYLISFISEYCTFITNVAGVIKSISNKTE